MSDTEALLTLAGVSVTYRAFPALKPLDWQWQPGEQWVCLGPNGAGKTTLAGVISGQLTHFSGAKEVDPSVSRAGIAYVCFERAQALVERDRKLDVAEFSPEASDVGTRVSDLIGPSIDAPDIRDWIDYLQMQHILERGLRYISTGEMRKTLLVAAIAQRPGLLILDSPMDGLDRASRATLGQALESLLASGQPTLLLCRDPDDVPAGCTHVLLLDDGEAVALGPRRAVLDDPATAALLCPELPPLAPLPAPAERPYRLPEGPLVELRSVSVAYGETTVLDRVSWTFSRGQHTCITGPNGCGKTTLLSLLTGDNHKAYGQDITLFGIRRGSGESVWEIKQKFGVIDTQLQLTFAKRMRVIEVVTSGFFDSVGLYDQWSESQRSTAGAWLRALGVGAIGNAGYDELSFGLQRMVLLARAMVKAPAILILDEPTLGLDRYHRELILRAVDHIAQNADTQILFVSHAPADQPACINQWLTFEPREDGYRVLCEE